MEFFYPGGFAHDYEYTTRALGMRHYGFWGDQYVKFILVLTTSLRTSVRHFTSPNTPLPKYVEGFQGNEIPIDGELVARLCVYRLSLSFELDD